MWDAALDGEKDAHSESVLRQDVSQEFESNGGKELSVV
jgi:hypothetical protein